MKMPAIFRRLTVDEARQRLAKHAAAMSQHHQLEAMRLRFESSAALSHSFAHEEQAESYARLAKEYGS